MSDQSNDTVRLTEEARRGWDAAATGWKSWAPTIEAAGQEITDRLIEMARIRTGDAVLEIGSGHGETLVAILARVGSTGHAVATDLSERMVELARERTADAGLDNASFYATSGETLDIPDRDFDAALSRWVLMLMADPDACLRRVHTLLKPGGYFAAAVFSDPASTPFLTVAGSTIRRETGVGPPQPGEPNVFRFADARELEQTFQTAGFEEMAVEQVGGTCVFASPEEYVQFMQEAARDIARLLDDKPPERQAEIWQAVADASREYQAPDGRIHLGLECHCISGRKPSAA